MCTRIKVRQSKGVRCTSPRTLALFPRILAAVFYLCVENIFCDSHFVFKKRTVMSSQELFDSSSEEVQVAENGKYYIITVV